MDDLSKIRTVVSDTLLNMNSINRLMKDKVEDYILVEEQPMPIKVGKKILFIGNLTLENEMKFFGEWGQLFGMLAGRIANWKLSTERKKELIEKADFKLLSEGKWLKEFLWRDKWFVKRLVYLIGKLILRQQGYYLDINRQRQFLRWNNCSFAYFKKNITNETLIEICWYINLYNFDSVKKNVSLILDKMNQKDLMEQYIPSWLQSCPGVHGKFLHAQVPSPDYIFDESANSGFQDAIPNKSNQEKKGQHNG